MNRVSKFLPVAIAILLALAISTPAWAQAHPKNAQGEEFFIVSSVDLQKHQVVLMRPTQLTVVATIGPQTTYLGEKGQKLDVKAMKAGDTVWGITKPGPDGSVTAVRLRQGAMTPAELHKLYLQLPASNTYSAPMTPRPQSGAQAAPPAISSGGSPYSTQLSRPRTRHHRPEVL
ncbi:MAG TPA: hypothetical protein VKT50_06175 [Candidatus Acidoferrales bacterium]|nr:hypothetical protein [Candidatus Acidoferrales bacterium]